MTGTTLSPGPHPRRAELRALTGLRAVAALAVVVSHTRLPPDAPGPLVRLADWGYIGVPLFFLLSGVVLAYNYPDLRPGGGVLRFYLARVARVMPLYWVMIAYCAAVYHAVRLPQHPEALRLNILALQTWGGDLPTAQQYYNGPGWSIGVELFFYALFPLLAPVVAGISRRWGPRGLVAVVALAGLVAGLLWWWFVATGRAALPAADPGSAHRWLYRNPLCHLTEFVAGLAIAHLLPRGTATPVGAHHLLQAVVVMYTAGLAAFRPPSSPTLAAGSFSALFLVPFALLLWSLGSGRGWLARLLSTGVMVRLGVASYALYLTHRWLIWQLSTGKAITTAPGSRGWFALLFTLGILLLVAEGAHRCIENPARRWMLRLAPSRRPDPSGTDGGEDVTGRVTPSRA